jgi:hypothetical protein
VEEELSTFPQIMTGVTTQLPWTTISKFIVSRVEMDAGPRYGYYYSANAQNAWELSFSVLTDGELTTLRNFWNSMRGGWDTFSFTDPDTGTTHANCRFDGDTFDLTRNGPNEYSLRLVIVALP